MSETSDKDNNIHKLARDGKLVENQYQSVDELDKRDANGRTPLQHAVLNNHVDVVDFLLKRVDHKGGKENAGYMVRDEQNNTLAHYAAKIDRGKTRHEQSEPGQSIESTSSVSSPGDVKSILKLLIRQDKKLRGDQGELIYLQDDVYGQTPLHCAVMSGGIQNVRDLIEADKTKEFVNKKDKQGMTALHVAATYKQNDIAEYLLTVKAQVDCVDASNSTPLHYACLTANLTLIDILLEKEPVLSTEDNGGNTCVHVAAESGHYNVLERLIKAEDNGGNTCVHVAAESGHNDVLERLIKAGASTHTRRKDGMYPLHLAVKTGKQQTVEMILEKSKDNHVFDSPPCTPLHTAAQYNRLDIIELLLKKKNSHCKVDDIDQESNTALHIAALHNDKDAESVMLLLKHGANIHARNRMRRTPLHLAADRNKLAAVKALIRPENTEAGRKCLKLSEDRRDIKRQLENLKSVDTAADERKALDTVHRHLVDRNLLKEEREPDSKIRHYVKLIKTTKQWKRKSTVKPAPRQNGVTFQGNRTSRERKDVEKQPRLTSLRREKTIVPTDDVDVLIRQAYIDNIANTEDEDGNTALHLAAAKGHIDIVKYMLEELHVERDRKNDTESTALHLAALNGHVSTVKVLVERHPHLVFAEDQNCNTPTHLAATHGHTDIVDILIARGADVNHVNSDKKSALDLAAEHGKLETCQALVKERAQTWLKSKEVTPLHLACANGHLDVVKILLKSRPDFASRDSHKFNCLDIAIDNGQREVVRYILESQYWNVALQNSVEMKKGSKKIATPMRRLIKKMPDMAFLVLDKCSTDRTKEEQKDLTKKDFKKEYDYDYQYVDDLMTEDGWNLTDDKRKKYKKKNRAIEWAPYTKKGTVIKKNHPLALMVKHKREDLLQHHLVRGLIRQKWWSYGAYYYLATFIFHLFFLLLLTRYVLQTKPPHNFTSAEVQSIMDDNCDSVAVDSFFVTYLQVEKFLLYTLMVLSLIFEIIQMWNMGVAYLNTIESYVEWISYILSFLFLLEFSNCTIRTGYRQPWQWSLGAFAIFFVWIDLVLYLKAFTSLGIYVIMFEIVCWTFLKVFIVFLILITAFALAFHTLLQNKIPFRDTANSILKTGVMFIGELDYESLINEGVADGSTELLYPVPTSMLFSIFITLASIVLMNLLVGLAVDDIQGIKRKAAFKRTAMHIDLVLDVEKVLPHGLRQKIYRRREQAQEEMNRGWCCCGCFCCCSCCKKLWRWICGSRIWWWNQKPEPDELDSALLALPEKQEKLERSVELLRQQISDLTRLLKPVIQEGNEPSLKRSESVPGK